MMTSASRMYSRSSSTISWKRGLSRQAVHRQRRLVRVAFGIDVAVEVVTGEFAVEKFNATHFDDAVAGAGI
jgi:hypothetical protein